MRRRVKATLEIGADSWDDLAKTFHDIGTQILIGQHRGNVTSGGWASGYHFTADEDESVTGDEYRAWLSAGGHLEEADDD